MRHNPECEDPAKRGLRKTLRYPVSGFGKNLLNVRLTFCMLAAWNDGQADEGMRWLAQSAFRPGRIARRSRRPQEWNRTCEDGSRTGMRRKPDVKDSGFNPGLVVDLRRFLYVGGLE